jgi:hypothetical protein
VELLRWLQDDSLEKRQENFSTKPNNPKILSLGSVASKRSALLTMSSRLGDGVPLEVDPFKLVEIHSIFIAWEAIRLVM